MMAVAAVVVVRGYAQCGASTAGARTTPSGGLRWRMAGSLAAMSGADEQSRGTMVLVPPHARGRAAGSERWKEAEVAFECVRALCASVGLGLSCEVGRRISFEKRQSNVCDRVRE